MLYLGATDKWSTSQTYPKTCPNLSVTWKRQGSACFTLQVTTNGCHSRYASGQVCHSQRPGQGEEQAARKVMVFNKDQRHLWHLGRKKLWQMEGTDQLLRRTAEKALGVMVDASRVPTSSVPCQQRLWQTSWLYEEKQSQPGEESEYPPLLGIQQITSETPCQLRHHQDSWGLEDLPGEERLRELCCSARRRGGLSGSSAWCSRNSPQRQYDVLQRLWWEDKRQRSCFEAGEGQTTRKEQTPPTRQLSRGARCPERSCSPHPTKIFNT